MSNASDATTASTVDQAESVIAGAAKIGRKSGFVRAMMYTPVVLFATAYAAVATYPGLAEYASPIIDLTKARCEFLPVSSISDCEQARMQKCSVPQVTPASTDENSLISDVPADAMSVANSAE